ncbi:hypothetical protein Hdeb2414_s0525g00910641 [Helianthus debilis subsp. tardiflorus]
MMSYEGTYPRTTKKLFHPYWSFLAHVCLVCISGNKCGIDTLTIRQTSGMVALVQGWKFNYSKCVFDYMMVNVRTINKKYWFKFPWFLQMILDAKYPQLQHTVNIYDTKMMNHMVFAMIKQVRKDMQVMYENRKSLEKFGAFPDVVEQVQAPVNASVAEEHDVQIIDAPPRTEEPVENIDLTEVENEEENVFEETLMADAEVNENVGEDETEIGTESIIADEINEDQMLSEVHTADLHPRKRGRRDTRISREITSASSSNPEAKIPQVNASNSVSATGTPVSDLMIKLLTNPKAAMYMPAPKTSEGSSNAPSEAEVLRATTLLEQVVRESAATAKLAQEKAHELASSSDSENLFGDVDIGALMKRITVFEEDKIFKDVEIASLLEEITHKNQQIQELETNLGSLSAIIMDLK